MAENSLGKGAWVRRPFLVPYLRNSILMFSERLDFSILSGVQFILGLE